MPAGDWGLRRRAPQGANMGLVRPRYTQVAGKSTCTASPGCALRTKFTARRLGHRRHGCNLSRPAFACTGGFRGVEGQPRWGRWALAFQQVGDQVRIRPGRAAGPSRLACTSALSGSSSVLSRARVSGLRNSWLMASNKRALGLQHLVDVGPMVLMVWPVGPVHRGVGVAHGMSGESRPRQSAGRRRGCRPAGAAGDARVGTAMLSATTRAQGDPAHQAWPVMPCQHIEAEPDAVAVWPWCVPRGLPAQPAVGQAWASTASLCSGSAVRRQAVPVHHRSTDAHAQGQAIANARPAPARLGGCQPHRPVWSHSPSPGGRAASSPANGQRGFIPITKVAVMARASSTNMTHQADAQRMESGALCCMCRTGA